MPNEAEQPNLVGRISERYRKRAETRFLIVRKAAAFYREFPPQTGGVSVRVRWRSPGQGWRPVLEPAPYPLHS